MLDSTIGDPIERELDRIRYFQAKAKDRADIQAIPTFGDKLVTARSTAEDTHKLLLGFINLNKDNSTRLHYKYAALSILDRKEP